MTADTPRTQHEVALDQIQRERPRTDAELAVERAQRAAKAIDSPLRGASVVAGHQTEGKRWYIKADECARELLRDAFGLPTDNPLIIKGSDGYLVEIDISRIRAKVIRKGEDHDD